MPLTIELQSNLPIKHLAYIIQENHSFDNYFGTYPGANGIPPGTKILVNPNATSSLAIAPFHLNGTLPISIVGDELPPGVSNPEQLGNSSVVSPFHLPSLINTQVSSAWQAPQPLLVVPGNFVAGMPYTSMSNGYTVTTLNSSAAGPPFYQSDLPVIGPAVVAGALVAAAAVLRTRRKLT